ncbi:MAG: Ig-like domain-containing protein [Longimicrobiales bacterium]
MIPTVEESAVDVFDTKRGWALGLALALAAAGCGGGGDGGSTGPDVVSVKVEPAAALAVGVGDTVRFTAKVVDEVGAQVTGAVVTWHSANAAVATVDGQGRAVGMSSGTTSVSATSDGVSGTASLEVWAPATVTVYQAGTSYFGRQSYVEYIPGELPVILSAPHGGSLTPSEIPDRTSGTTVTDTNARETLLAVREALIVRTGKAPHVVIAHLKRTKLDPNREIVEAAAGNVFAENAWNEFHAYLEIASAAVTKTYGSGFYMDLHGHGHAIARAELGYMLSASQLNRTDAEINAPGVAAQSSIRALAASSPLPFAQLLRGSTSLGGLMQKEGVRSVPSPGDPSPGTNDYFAGGYNTERYGSFTAGRTVSGVQIELPLPGIRDTAANRQAFGEALARAVEAYMTEHFGFFSAPK